MLPAKQQLTPAKFNPQDQWEVKSGNERFILNGTEAQILKDQKQSEYNTAYNRYLASKQMFDDANTALNSAKTLETQAGQALAAAITVRDGKKAVYDNKVSVRQGLEAAIASLPSQIQALQTQLVNANKQLPQAKSEETTAKNNYTNAQNDVNTKQATYNSRKQDRINKEAAFAAASTNPPCIPAVLPFQFLVHLGGEYAGRNGNDGVSDDHHQRGNGAA